MNILVHEKEPALKLW